MFARVPLGTCVVASSIVSDLYYDPTRRKRVRQQGPIMVHLWRCSQSKQGYKIRQNEVPILLFIAYSPFAVHIARLFFLFSLFLILSHSHTHSHSHALSLSLSHFSNFSFIKQKTCITAHTREKV